MQEPVSANLAKCMFLVRGFYAFILYSHENLTEKKCAGFLQIVETLILNLSNIPFKNLILLLFLNFSVKILTINFLLYVTLVGSSMEANCLWKRVKRLIERFND